MNKRHIPPQVRLPPEAQKKLENLKEDIEAATYAIENMEEVGVDVGRMKAELGDAISKRRMLLKAFTNSTKI